MVTIYGNESVKDNGKKLEVGINDNGTTWRSEKWAKLSDITVTRYEKKKRK